MLSQPGIFRADVALIHLLHGAEMEPWDPTILRLASLSTGAEPTDSFDAQRAIDSFIHHIKNPYFDAKIVKAFRNEHAIQTELPKYVTFSGNIHCELALALLVERSAQGGDASLGSLVCAYSSPLNIR